MKYHYGGHPDQSEFVYWLDESGCPVGRILFEDFSRVCATGDSCDFEKTLKAHGVALPTVGSLIWEFGQPLIPPIPPSEKTLVAIDALSRRKSR